jgi:hypothetical protein
MGSEFVASCLKDALFDVNVVDLFWKKDAPIIVLPPRGPNRRLFSWSPSCRPGRCWPPIIFFVVVAERLLRHRCPSPALNVQAVVWCSPSSDRWTSPAVGRMTGGPEFSPSSRRPCRRHPIGTVLFLFGVRGASFFPASSTSNEVVSHHADACTHPLL